MFKTAGLFEENPIQGNLAGVSAEIPDLFGIKFDRLNPSSQIPSAIPMFYWIPATI
jgi:hypothetical protein